MNKSALKLVAKSAPVPMPYDESRGKRRMETLRAQLLSNAVRYVKEGKDGTRSDRLRTASNLSGIPIVLIEVEAAR